jgi:hypothetical protein
MKKKYSTSLPGCTVHRPRKPLDTRQQAALSAGTDAFIKKSEMPPLMANRLRMIAESLPAKLSRLAVWKDFKNRRKKAGSSAGTN